MPTLRIVEMSSEYALGVVGPVLIQLWERGTPDEGARRACEEAESLARSPHPRTGSLIIVPEDAALPSPDARKLLSELPGKLDRGAGVALVREGTGFRSAAVRAVMTGIMMLARDPVPHEVFSGTGPGIEWLLRRLQSPTLDLAGAVDELRRDFAIRVSPQ